MTMFGHFGQFRRRCVSTSMLSSRPTCSSAPPSNSWGSSTFFSSKLSNQMPPQPPWQTSTVSCPTVTCVNVLSQAGQIMLSSNSSRHARWQGAFVIVSQNNVISGNPIPVEYEVPSDPARLDIDLIHGFLRSTYWAADMPRKVLEKSIRKDRKS